MKTFITENAKTISIIVSFLLTVYVQHINNTNQLIALAARCDALELKVQQQYERVDLLKLDKTVFEATIASFSTLKDDMREIRSDIKELLKNK